MFPVHDVDALLLLAISLAAKRRPAEPAEILAAVDLIHGNIPDEKKLADAFVRLGQAGLIVGADGGTALTATAEGMIETLPRKAEAAERLSALRTLLADSSASGEAVLLPAAELRAALLAYRASAAGKAKNLLVPKPKPTEAAQRPGQRRRKPLPAAKRKSRNA